MATPKREQKDMISAAESSDEMILKVWMAC
jgi:hypothetical protein